MADKFSKEVRSRNMKAIRSKETKLEQQVAQELWKRGFRFRKNVKKLFGTPDISISKYKVAVFLDSCFWHGCQLHGNIPENNQEYWTKKLEYNKKRDIEVTQYYKEHGWLILRVWEHEVKEDLNRVINRISELIHQAKVRYSNQ